MKISLAWMVFGVGALFGTNALAEAPAGAIAQCKDGTYYSGTSHKGACKGHEGVKEWLDKDKSASTTAPASDKSSTKKSKKNKSSTSTTSETAAAPAAAPAKPAATPAPAPATTPAPTPSSAATTTKKPPTPSSEIAQKPGGGAGQVWVNSESKVYHCQGDQWYGKTKQGSYMTEAAAKAAGNHAAHGKDCSG